MLALDSILSLGLKQTELESLSCDLSKLRQPQNQRFSLLTSRVSLTPTRIRRMKNMRIDPEHS